jgi:phosphate transport system substrate-binding protein
MNRVLWTATLLLGAGCKKEAPAPAEPAAAPAPAALSGTIKADGSSTVYPISEAVAEEFGKKHPGVRVTVGISGTGGGFKKFCAGETDLSDASRPIKPSEVLLCANAGVESVELPVAYDGLAVLVNPANDWAASITVAELKRLWEPEAQGNVKKWSDVRTGWPDKEIHLFGAGVDSGTYDYFTEAIVGKEHASRGDFTSSEDDNVLVQGIATDPLALGFFGFAYYVENQGKLKLLPVDDGNPQNGDGAVAPSLDTVRKGTYQPLSRPLFVYFAKKSLERPEVAEFARFYLANASKLVGETGYIPLPDGALAAASERLEARRTGSIFGGAGSQVGVSIEDLLTREKAK